ncbi:MAG: Holliday junction resolvase RuvX [Clostridiales bacterium]|nr:Holliday junction resolvase RuvX [Clostridiales bacterium]
MSQGRVMGIDFGTRHIGVALSDELRIIASGFETVNWNGVDDSKALERIAQIVREKNVSVIVLGKPRRTDGTQSETEIKAIEFGKKLTELTGIEPVMKDERYTTVIASRMLHDVNVNAKKQKKIIDQVAAEVIVREYLQQHG